MTENTATGPNGLSVQLWRRLSFREIQRPQNARFEKTKIAQKWTQLTLATVLNPCPLHARFVKSGHASRRWPNGPSRWKTTWGLAESRSIPMPGNARFEKSKSGWKISASDLGLVSYGVPAACPLAQNRASRYRLSTQVLFRKQLKLDVSLPALTNA